jgi:tetratricopeptide (TPR) repeat protein
MPKLPSFARDAPLLPVGQTAVLLRRAKQARAQGDRGEGIRLFRQILAIDPMHAEAAGCLGMTLMENGDPAAAIEHLENALRIDPEQPTIWLFRGMALADTGRFLDALASFERTLALRPDDELAQVHRGGTLYRLGRFQEARPIAEAIVARLPDDAGQAASLGLVLQWCGQPDAAMREYDRALALDPNNLTARNNRSMLLMFLGELPTGWREYECRWRAEGLEPSERHAGRPLWLGQCGIAGKTLLIHHEQGFGDTLQFCRYAMLAARAGARVILEVQEPLAELMTTLPCVDRVITGEDPLPEHDLHCPTLSLPLAFGTTLDTIPAEIPYLSADPAKVANWRNRLTAQTGLRVGLVWAGSSRFGSAEMMATDFRRSLPLRALAPLASVAGCSFVSLQVGPPAGQAKSPPAGMILHDPTSLLGNFADTAALIETLDLVISADTAVVHLAGAMGKPVWMMNRFDSCWRWLRDREDSPWYPTMRLFRQTTSGNWDDVVRRVASALRALVAARASGERAD